MKRTLLPKRTVLLISFLVVLVDQASKELVSRLLIGKASLTIVPSLLAFRVVRNTGAAFSLFNQSTEILALLSIAVSISLIFMIWTNRYLNNWRGLGFCFLLGGSIGNGFDRIRLGYVIDFIELLPLNFPIFNCADMAINLAVLCLIIETIVNRRHA